MSKLGFVFLSDGGRQIMHMVHSDGATLTFDGTPQEFLNDDTGIDHIIAVLAGEDVSTWSIDVPDIADNKLLQILPVQLEDMKAVIGIDDHYALLSKNEDGTRLVACVSAKVMEETSQTLAVNGINADLLIADYLLLKKTSEANIVRTFDDDSRYICRLSDGSGFAANKLIINELTPINDIDELGLHNVSLDSLQSLNLLQGRYKRGVAIAAYLPFLYRAAILAGMLLLVWAGSVFMSAQRDQAEANALSAETEALFRNAFPDITRIVNMEAQARRLITQGTSSAGGAFLRISEDIFVTVANFDGAVLEGLRFNEEQSSFFVNVSFAVFSESDDFLSQLRAKGLRVTEGGSRQEDGRVITDIAIELAR
ncbi:type II secretion system protein GspL [Kordiimonas aquimaris]|uniref:type II secretion system protein GspL n=1 Tax=Kordiimonas aquimaris TaxID=707591 RepID=UPI0021CE82B9|nr:type II secretion system protein GspL [Kordiimonas aquimaris]